MRILIDCRSINERPSGVGHYLMNIIKALSGEDVILTGVIDGVSSVLAGLAQDCTMELFEMGRVASHSIRIFHYFSYIEDLLEKTTPDLFWEPYPIFMPSLFHRPLQTRIVTTIHDLFPLYLRDSYPWSYRLYARWGISRTAELSDGILAVSSVTRNDVVNRLNVDESKVWVIPPIVEKPALRESDVNIVSGVSGRDGYFIFLGNLERRKGIHFLLPAFKRYVDNGGKCSLVLCGNLNRACSEGDLIAHYVEELPDRIVCVGYVSENAKWQLLENDRCLAMVLPSLYEGFGIPPVEAALAGRISLLPDISIYHETLGDSAVFYDVTQGDETIIQNLEKGLRFIEKNEPVISGMERVCIEKRYSSGRVTGQLLRYFTKVVSEDDSR